MEEQVEKNDAKAMLDSILLGHAETDVVYKLHDVLPLLEQDSDVNVWDWVNDGGLAKLCQFLDRTGFICQSEKIPETSSAESKKDYSKIRSLAREVFDLLEILLTKCQKQDTQFQCLPQTIVTYLPLLIISLYSFADAGTPWSNEALKSSCLEIVALLRKIFKCGSVGELVQVDCSSGLKKTVEIPNEVSGTVLERVLSQLHPQLQKDSIICHPKAVTAFSQVLLSVGHPMLSGYVGHVLPLALSVLEDYTGTYTVTGAVCMAHIVEACTSEAIRRNNTGLVMFDALRKLYRQRPDPEVLERVAQVWIQVAVKSEAPSQCHYPLAPLKSEVLRTLLVDVEMEHYVKKRQVILAALVSVIPCLGLGLTRHLQLLLSALLRSLEVAEGEDEEARVLAVQAISSTVLVAWPRMPGHAPAVCKALLRLLLELAVSRNLVAKEEARAELRRHVIAALALLLRCCPDQVRPILTSVEAASDVHADVCSAAREALNARQGADEPSQLSQPCS